MGEGGGVASPHKKSPFTFKLSVTLQMVRDFYKCRPTQEGGGGCHFCDTMNEVVIKITIFS